MRVEKWKCLWIVMTAIGAANATAAFAQSGKNLPSFSERRMSLTLPADLANPEIAPHATLFTNNKFCLFALSTITAFCVAMVDAPMDEEYALESHNFPVSLAKSYGKIGNLYDAHDTYYYLAGLSGTAFAYGLLFHDKKVVNTVGLMFESYAVSSLITTTMKTIVGRDRPYANHGPAVFHPFKFTSKPSQVSFPSGHATTIFAMMTVLAKQYPQPWVSVPAYTLATSVAFQRMLYRKHWASDVIVGGAIGYLVGNSLVKKHHNRSTKLSFQPTVGVNRLGLSVDF